MRWFKARVIKLGNAMLLVLEAIELVGWRAVGHKPKYHLEPLKLGLLEAILVEAAMIGVDSKTYASLSMAT